MVAGKQLLAERAQHAEAWLLGEMGMRRPGYLSREMGVGNRELRKDATANNHEDLVSVRVESVKQKKIYTCAAAALQAMFDHYDVEVDQTVLEGECRPTPRDGTGHEAVCAVVRKHGFVPDARDGATISDITGSLDKGVPVMLDYRVSKIFPDDLVDFLPQKLVGFFDHLPQWMRDRLIDGHYSVAFGHDDNNLFIMDVYTGKIVEYPKAKFEKEWDYSRKDGHRWMMTIRLPS